MIQSGATFLAYEALRLGSKNNACRYTRFDIPKNREWDVVRARVFQCFLVFFICCVFCHLPHTFSVIFIKFIGFVSWYYLGIQLDSLCQLVLHVCIKI